VTEHDPALPAPAGAYSPVREVGGTVWTAGFGPQDPATGAVPEGITAQTNQVLSNVSAALSSRGLSLRDVVKVTTHLQHLKRDFPAYDAAYAGWFEEPYPVRTTVGSDLMDILVEIDVVAVREGGGRVPGVGD
jgi:2-iminobutanoate/2-iminopropanoate deaminase